ncbi:MAG TPA: hypothetical protein VMR25_04980 [Planctomycetaceae bacterium]|jgi:hypothetical protein|nr:hypothetical protein [Planctomycetaceae bacterium]
MPEEPKQARSRLASEEREKRAPTAKADGNREALENLAAAADRREASPEAILLWRPRTAEGRRARAANTVLRDAPIDLMIRNALNSLTQSSD